MIKNTHFKLLKLNFNGLNVQLSNAIESKCPNYAQMLDSVPVFNDINLIVEPRIVENLKKHSGQTNSYELFKVIDAIKCRVSIIHSFTHSFLKFKFNYLRIL